jgi:hypothetical protein
MPMLTLNLPLLSVFDFSTLQFLFGDRENLLHRSLEFLGWSLLSRGRNDVFHEPHYYTSWPLVQFFTSERAPSDCPNE